jgi:hypothetical protein
MSLFNESCNFRNNQMLLDVYVIVTGASIEIDDADESFLNEGITIAFESPALFVRKLYYEILKFSRTARYEMHTNEKVNKILTMTKDI